MEPAQKRRRTFAGQSLDADADLHELQARNNLWLKSTFESIFEKYGKDFSNVADEIDLKTGQIVVDRGHVLTMRDETDLGGLSEHDELDGTSAAEERKTDQEEG